MNASLCAHLLIIGSVIIGIAAEICDVTTGCHEKELMNTTKELSTIEEETSPTLPSYLVKIVPATSSVSILCNASEGVKYNGWMLIQENGDIDLPNEMFENIRVAVKGGIESLEIHHVRPEQAGTYVCETEQPSGFVQYLKLELQVTVDHLSTSGAEAMTSTEQNMLSSEWKTPAPTVTKSQSMVEASTGADALAGVAGVMKASEITTVELPSIPRKVGGCYGTRYGCCQDGWTAASGYNNLGCPEKSEVVFNLVFPTTDNPEQVVFGKTDTPRQAVESLEPPRNFKVIRDVVASDRVKVTATWEDSVDNFILSFSEDASIEKEYWGKISLQTNKWETALRRPSTYYFTITAVSGEITAESPVYVYHTEDEMSQEFTGACGPEGCLTTTESGKEPACSNTIWGCCLDGISAALGPDGLGCRDDESCDVSNYECCPDGVSKARGDNFEGCADLSTRPTVVNPLCLEVHNTTLCTEYSIKWFYDTEVQRCRRFWDGGCESSQNTFSTQARCNSVCNSQYQKEEGNPCSQVKGVVGICKGRHQRWTYNSRTNQCEQFDYGGCRGNDNNFLSANDCQYQCLNMEEGKDVCSMPVKSGPCYANFPRWYYNKDERVCKEFVYGGCDGNDNRFWSEEDCLKRCSQLDDRKPQDVCLLPEVQGQCRARFSQYSYDPATRRCNLFNYGGCGGNSNRFPDQQTCLSTCGPDPLSEDDKCLLPPQAGPCNGYFIRWYYDNVSNQCVQFMFGGCQGNSNNYQSEEECKSSCVEEQTTTDSISTNNVCMLNYDIGSCYGYEILYFYDKEAEICRRFVYSGCGGNSNRFSDVASCELACVQKDIATTTERVALTTTLPNVDQPAVITNPEEVRQTANIGEDATLKCAATGFPAPSYVWYKIRSPIDLATDSRYRIVDGNLIIRRVGADDTTEFICRAYNGVGSPDYLYVNLIVEDNISIDEIYEEVIAILGGNTSLSCNATKSPAVVVFWKFEGQVLAASDKDNSSLELFNLTAADRGNYFCTAENGVKWAQKVVLLIIVEPMRVALDNHPQVYNENQRLVLTCFTVSYLPVSLQWKKDGAVINTGGRVNIDESTLTVDNVVISDSGEYSCIASNTLESLHVSTNITVQPLVTTPAPVTGPCGDRPYLANCKLIVYYDYCSHEVYRHLCCKSCVEAGKVSRRDIRPSRYSINSLYSYRSNQPIKNGY